jgi:Mrp family chromosome partitioning ATPase
MTITTTANSDPSGTPSAELDLALSHSPSRTLSSARATDPTSGQQFRAALARTTASALAGVERMLPFVPGGVSTTAAVRATGSPGTGGSVGDVGAGLAASPGSPGVGASPGTVSAAAALQDSGDQALELIALQQRIGLEQRQFTTISNVMKARHDTVKNLIGNVR